jgi:transposase-like protein
MYCPNCSGEMNCIETDSRQEWFEETYACIDCGKTFVRRVEFKTQSNLIASDELKEIA